MELKTNLPSLTSLRGLAAIWVMFFHVDVIIFYRELGSLIPHDTSGIITKGYLWVDFFFILSGFIICHVYGEVLTNNFMNWPTVRSFLWARFSRVYPLHIFTLLLLMPFAILFPIISPSVVDGSWTTFFAWSAIWDNLVLINAMNQHNYLSWNIVAWSIGAEWWTYVAAIFILPLVYQKRNFQIFALAFLAIASLCWMVYFKKNLDITFDYGFFRCLAEFFLGAVVYQLYLKSIWKIGFSKNAVFLVLILLLVLIFHFKWNDLLVIPIFCFLILASVYNGGHVKRILESRFPSYLGKISYSIYMMHGFWFMVFWYCLPYLKTNYTILQLEVWMKVIYVLLFLGLTLISAHFTYQFVELRARKRMRQWLS
jgi:peptidoglycan/LPS O-acetylase OafA/YrhL